VLKYQLHSRLLPLAPLTTSTIAAACAGRTVAGVIAIRAYPGGEDPERKCSRQLQRGFEAAARTLSGSPGVRRRELGARPLNCSPGGARGLWCSRDRGWGWNQCGRTYPCPALPPAVFPHPCRSLCWIAIGHTFQSDACTVHRVPLNDLRHKKRLALVKPAEPGVRFLSKSSLPSRMWNALHLFHDELAGSCCDALRFFCKSDARKSWLIAGESRCLPRHVRFRRPCT